MELAPKGPGFLADGPGEGHCDEDYELCVTMQNAERLEKFIADALRWMREAETNCRDKGGEP